MSCRNGACPTSLGREYQGYVGGWEERCGLLSNLLEMVGCHLDELGMNFSGPRLVSLKTVTSPPGLDALVGCPP